MEKRPAEADSLVRESRTIEMSSAPPSFLSMGSSSSSGEKPSLNRIRAGYVAFLVIGFIIALVLRDGFSLMEKISALESCEGMGMSCYGFSSVYRISFSLAIFFLLHFLAASRACCCMQEESSQMSFQTGFWGLRFLAFLGIIVCTFFIPNEFFKYFAYVAMALSWFYIIAQILCLIEFAYSWNKKWASLAEKSDRVFCGITDWYAYILMAVLVMYGIGIAGLVIEYTWFTHPEGCGLNKFFISWTLITGVLFTLLALKAARGILPAAVVFMYNVYLCWSSIMSNPDAACYEFSGGSSNPEWNNAQLVIGAIFVAVSIGYTSFSSGSSQDALSTSSDEWSELKLMRLSHIMMFLASLYFSMLLTGWQATGTSSELEIDKGPTSMWIKIVSQWVTTILYSWSLLAPICFPDRDFD